MPRTKKLPVSIPVRKAGYVAYYRVSTIRQGESGLGLDAQRTAVLRYLHGRGELLGEYTEVESGRKVDRKQLAAAIAAAKRQGATLIIAKLDRLARNVAFIANLMNSGLDFTACDMPHANKLTIHILAAIAEHEREMISARTKAALAEVKARGIKLGNPRWQESLARARACRHASTSPASVVDMLVRMREAGKTFRDIAKELNDAGLRTASGARWHPSSVRAALPAAPEEDLPLAA